MIIYKASNYYCLNNFIYKKLPAALQKNIIKKVLKSLGYPAKPNYNMLNSLSGMKKKFLYKNKNFYSISRENYLWLINLKNSGKPLIKTLTVNKIPFKYNNEKLKFEIKRKIISNPKAGFSFKNNSKILPIKLRILKKNDKIYINKNNKKLIKNILKSKKIPSFLFAETIVVEESGGMIIGFIFNSYFRISHNFYIKDKKAENLILIIKND